MKLRTLMLIVTAICGCLGSCLGLYRGVAGPVIPDAVLDQLRPGMSTHEVESVLGPPSIRRDNDTMAYPTSEAWVYQRGINVGHVEVYFDHDGTLSSVNDESVFPRHQRRPDSPPLP